MLPCGKSPPGFEPGQGKEELREGKGRSLVTPFEHPDTAVPETLIFVVFSVSAHTARDVKTHTHTHTP